MNYSYPLFRPPSEAASFIVQLSYGCSSNTCQFCGMYKSVKYSKRNVEDVIAEIKNIPDYYRNDIKRIFIADGDPIHSGFEVLKTLVVFLNRFFPNLQRISAYALPQLVLKLTEPELEILNKLKLKLFYMGLETGSDELYKFISKKGSMEIGRAHV